MPPKPGTPPDKPQPHGKEELALLLRDAVRHSVQIEREAALAMIPKETRGRPVAMGIFVAIALAFSAWSFIAKPAFIWGAGASTIAPEREEAGVRLAMFLQARRLDLHRAKEGEYPDALSEVGGDTTLGYRLTDDGGFVLTATAAGRTLVLTSTDNREAFLGRSRDIVQQRMAR